MENAAWAVQLHSREKEGQLAIVAYALRIFQEDARAKARSKSNRKSELLNKRALLFGGNKTLF